MGRDARRRADRHVSSAARFARLNAREAVLVEGTVPAGPPPAPLVALSTLANGSRLWYAVAAALTLRPGATRRAAAEGVVGVALAGGTTQVLNRLVGRPRPPADSPARRVLHDQPVTPSFPSSHTAVAVAFTTAVARRSPGLAAGLAPLAATLAYGRVRLRVHWPTDVLGGAVLGLVAGRAARPAYERLRNALPKR